VFYLHSKVASVFRQSGLSVHWQLHVTFLMLPTKNYKQKFKFVKVISQNNVTMLALFTLNTMIMAFSMTS